MTDLTRPAYTLTVGELLELLAECVPQAQAPVAAPLKLGYTLPEAVEVSGCTEWELRTAIRRGELAARQAGQRGRYVIHHEHLDRFVRGLPSTNVTVPARKGVRQDGQKLA